MEFLLPTNMASQFAKAWEKFLSVLWASGTEPSRTIIRREEESFSEWKSLGDRGGSHSTAGGPTGRRRVCLQARLHLAACLLPSPIGYEQVPLDPCIGFGHVLTHVF